MITLVSLIVMTKCCLLNLCVLCGEKKLAVRGKLDDRWSEEVYLVISQPSEEVPVYQLAPEGGGVGPEPFIITSSSPSLVESQRSYTLSLLQRPNPSSPVLRPRMRYSSPAQDLRCHKTLSRYPVHMPKNESTSVQPEPTADPQVLPELKPVPAQVPKTESSGVCPEASASSHREVNDTKKN
nr:hypothetical protein BaRGS_003736 [Batillaria attramentaria]